MAALVAVALAAVVPLDRAVPPSEAVDQGRLSVPPVPGRRFSPAMQPGPSALSVPGGMLEAVSNQSAVSPVFVGRTEELSTLTDALRGAAAGTPQALLLGGEAGIGKTRLLEELLAAANASGAVTAVGGCLELGADGLPFAPFATALRSLHRTLGAAELATAAAGREAELARLLPDLAPAEPHQGPGHLEAHGEDGRARLFELTARLLERLAAERTVVLALEDLHWADRSTRELLGYLYRSLQSSRLIVLATFRSDDVHRRHPLRYFLAELDRLRTVRRIELSRLDRDEVRAQIAGIQGVSEPEPALVDGVFERSEGNPFFVEELTACRTTAGISQSLRDLLLVRIEGLSQSTQQVLRIAAQGGSAVEHALLAEVSELPEEELLEALRGAVGANLLQPTEDGEGYRFRHALLREAVSDDLLPGEGPRLNRRYARALQAAPELVRAEQLETRLAHYWYHGRDAGKALPAVLAASVAARRRHAFAEQHQLLERAIELWEEVPEAVRAELRPIDDAGVYPPCAAESGATALCFVDLLAEAVVAARTGGAVERALPLVKSGLEKLDETTEPLRAAWFWVQCSVLTEDLGRGDGWDEIGKAQELVRPLPPSGVHAEVLAGAARWGMLYRPGRDALSTAVRAAEVARTVGTTALELQARTTAGVLTSLTGDVEAGLAELAAVRDQAAAEGLWGVATRAEGNIADELEGIGRSRESAASAQRAVEDATRNGRVKQLGCGMSNHAEALLSLGEWESAQRLLARARASDRTQDTHGWAWLLEAALAESRGGQRAEAAVERALRQAREALGARRAEPQRRIPLRRLTASLAARRGDVDGARSELLSALREGFPPGARRFVWPLLHSAAVHESGFRGLPAARAGRGEILAELRAATAELGGEAPVWRAYGLLTTAELGRAEGRSAPEEWAAAAAAFEPLERPYELAQARHRWAEALLESPPGSAADPSAADPSGAGPARLLALAHAAAVGLGAEDLTAEVEQLAGRARIELPGPDAEGSSVQGHHPRPASPPDPAEAFGLTRRERDVLALVSAGRSNRQIAQELFIAPKTASVHVSNILAKLEVTSRGEAAAMAFRLRLTPPTASAAASPAAQGEQPREGAGSAGARGEGLAP